MTLDGTVVSAAFDDALDMGIVGTTAGTLWYISWAESTSIRLISGHKDRVGVVAFCDAQVMLSLSCQHFHSKTSRFYTHLFVLLVTAAQLFTK